MPIQDVGGLAWTLKQCADRKSFSAKKSIPRETSSFSKNQQGTFNSTPTYVTSHAESEM